MVVSFTVHGTPAPQGSKVQNRFGGFREANPRTRPWRQEVAAEAHRAMNGNPPMLGPVEVYARFYFPRPKSHFRTGRHKASLRPSAPVYVTGRPDLDKLARALGDALSTTCIRDDAQIVRLVAGKAYSERPSLEVEVRELGLPVFDPSADIVQNKETGERVQVTVTERAVRHYGPNS